MQHFIASHFFFCNIFAVGAAIAVTVTAAVCLSVLIIIRLTNAYNKKAVETIRRRWQLVTASAFNILQSTKRDAVRTVVKRNRFYVKNLLKETSEF